MFKRINYSQLASDLELLSQGIRLSASPGEALSSLFPRSSQTGSFSARLCATWTMPPFFRHRLDDAEREDQLPVLLKRLALFCRNESDFRASRRRKSRRPIILTIFCVLAVLIITIPFSLAILDSFEDSFFLWSPPSTFHLEPLIIITILFILALAGAVLVMTANALGCFTWGYPLINISWFLPDFGGRQMLSEECFYGQLCNFYGIMLSQEWDFYALTQCIETFPHYTHKIWQPRLQKLKNQLADLPHQRFESLIPQTSGPARFMSQTLDSSSDLRNQPDAMLDLAEKFAQRAHQTESNNWLLALFILAMTALLCMGLLRASLGHVLSL